MSFEQKFFRTAQHEIENEEEAAKHWRRVLLKLSNNLNAASMERADLSPVLMDALHHALEKLLLLGDEADLMALEEWVDMEHDQNSHALPGEEPHAVRNDADRRYFSDRRFSERRIASHFQAENSASDSATPHTPERRQNSERRQRPTRRRS